MDAVADCVDVWDAGLGSGVGDDAVRVRIRLDTCIVKHESRRLRLSADRDEEAIVGERLCGRTDLERCL